MAPCRRSWQVPLSVLVAGVALTLACPDAWAADGAYTRVDIADVPVNGDWVSVTLPRDAAPEELRDLVDLCEARGVMIIADEIYDQFTFSDALEDGRCPSQARCTEQMLLVRGFGKTYGCTGWRMGYAAGPRAIIEQMAKLQQYSFVCAPSIAQRGLIGALGLDMSAQVAAYQAKRDMVEQALSPVAEIVHPGGAFYAFVRIPTEIAATATEFVERAIERNVLLIPGCVFSGRDTHMRLSYAVPDETLDAGLRILTELLARRS